MQIEESKRLATSIAVAKALLGMVQALIDADARPSKAIWIRTLAHLGHTANTMATVELQNPHNEELREVLDELMEQIQALRSWYPTYGTEESLDLHVFDEGMEMLDGRRLLTRAAAEITAEKEEE